MLRVILPSALLAASLASCAPEPAGPPHPLAGAWRTSPEDLPYSGSIPHQKHVAINLDLSADGRGRWRPFYSGDGHAHLPSDEADAQRFRWRADDGTITLDPEDGGAACRGSVSGGRIELEAAGCGFLARLVSLPKVAFSRQIP